MSKVSPNSMAHRLKPADFFAAIDAKNRELNRIKLSKYSLIVSDTSLTTCGMISPLDQND